MQRRTRIGVIGKAVCSSPRDRSGAAHATPREISAFGRQSAEVNSDDRIQLAQVTPSGSDAIEALISRYAPGVYRLAYGITRSDHRAVLKCAFEALY